MALFGFGQQSADKVFAPGRTGWAVTNTTITCPDTTPRRSRQWRSRPVPLSSL